MRIPTARYRRSFLGLAVALAFLAVALTFPDTSLAQDGGFSFAPEEQVSTGREEVSPDNESGEEYNLPDWVPRYPNSNRPYWLPPEDGLTPEVTPGQGPVAPSAGPEEEKGFFAPPQPPPTQPPAPPAPPEPPKAREVESAEFVGEVLQYYMFTDDQGVTHLTDAPADPRYRLFTIEISVTSDKAPFRLLNLDRVRPFIKKASTTYKVDPALITAIIKAESAFDPKAISWAGARGLMQLMPNTARMMGVTDSFDPEQNIMGGTRYLRLMLNRFNGDVILAVAAYNCGPERVARVMAVPEIRETKNYVRTVLRNYETFLQMLDLEEEGQTNPTNGNK